MAKAKWRQYQEATAKLFRKLGHEAIVEFSAKGVRATHNIDVHVTFFQNGIKCTWIIECKLLGRRVSKEKVMALKSIVEDLGADRGIIFTEKGFQPGAKAAAGGTNITLATSLREFEKAALASPHSKMAREDVATIFETYAEELDDAVEGKISISTEIAPSEITDAIKARRGQGLFRANLLLVEQCCRLTGMANPSLLVASHIKPWRACTHSERMDGHNGLLLAPHVDLLFDKGLISFKNDGALLVSSYVTNGELEQLGLSPENHKIVRPFLAAQHKYLEYHRSHVFRGS